MSVNLKNNVRPTTTAPTANTATRALALKWKPPTTALRLVNGVFGGLGSTMRPVIHFGSQNSRAANPSPTKMVATVSTSRDAFAKRRTTMKSTTRPATTPVAIAITNDARYGKCHRLLMRSTASTADMAPISAMAKLMMRLAR